MNKSVMFIIFWVFSLIWLKESQGSRHSIRIIEAGDRLYFADVEWKEYRDDKGIITIRAYPGMKSDELFFIFGLLKNQGSMIKMSHAITQPVDARGHFIPRPFKLTELQASDLSAKVGKPRKGDKPRDGYIRFPFNLCALEEETPVDYVFNAVYKGEGVNFIATIVQRDSPASKKWRYTLGSGNTLAKEWVVVRRPYQQNGVQLDLDFIRNLILQIAETDGVLNVYELTDKDQFTHLVRTPDMKITPERPANVGLFATLTHTKSFTFEFQIVPNE